MKSKKWTLLWIVLVFLQFISLSKPEWVIADEGGGQDDDAIEIHAYENEDEFFYERVYTWKITKNIEGLICLEN